MIVVLAILALALVIGCTQQAPVEEDLPQADEAVEESSEDAEEEPLFVEDEPETETDEEPEELEETEDSEETLEEPASESPSVEVTTEGLTFTPDEVTIAVGDSVTFDLGSTHNVVQVSEENWNKNQKALLNGGFEVGFGETATISFDEPGTYYYVCQPHATMGMKGKIVVE